MMIDVTIYTRNGCGYCTAAVGLLKEKGVAFVEHNATTEPNARQEMLARANGRTTFPQVFIGSTHVGGCDDLYALERQGRLDGLLKTGELV
jgi:glutaredoxin 3